MMMTKDQAKMTAALIHSIRPDWDELGIMAALAKAANRAPAGMVSIAAIHAALATTNHTPAVIPMDGPHWQKADGTAPAPKRVIEPPKSNDTSADCPEHPGTKAWACKPCRTTAPRPADFQDRVARAAEAARAARAAQLVDL
jgi:hypothetical protein